MIKKLPSQYLQQVCYIATDTTQNKEFIFDLETMHAKKFRELEDYVKRMIDKCGLWEQKNCDEEEFSNESEFVIENDFD